MNYAVITVKKIKSMSGLQKLDAHNKRDYDMPHIDVSKTALNKSMVSNGSGIVDAWNDRVRYVEAMTERKVVTRKDAVKGITYVMSASDFSNINVSKWFEENYQWMCDKHGEENILAFDLHMDEHSPHIHAVVIPIDDRGKLCAKSFIDGPSSLRKLQNDYSEAMKSFGLSKPERYSKTKKITLDSFYGSLKQIEETEPPEKGTMSSQEYEDVLIDYIKDLRLATLKNKLVHKRIDEIVETRVDNQVRNVMSQYRDWITWIDELKESEDAALRLKQFKKLDDLMSTEELNELISSIEEQKYKEEHFDNKDEIYL